jgi:EpsI family protein
MGTAPVSLFIGYFPTQRSGQSIHSPQHCLPGAGWVFDSSGTTALAGPAGKPIEVGEYVISNGPAKDEVLYWYQSQGKAIAGDYKAKLYMLANSIRSNRTDAALVRVITPVREGESQAAAHQRAVGFAEKFVPLLPRYIPD